MKVLKVVIVFILLFSCKKNDQVGNVKLPTEKTKEVQNIENTSKSIRLKNEILNNEFAITPIGKFDFTHEDLTDFFKGRYNVVKETTINKYTDEVDTLIVFKMSNSKVKFYKSREKIMLDSVDVCEKDFVKFRLGIDIGMDKKNVLSLLKTSKNHPFSDTISVVDDEASSSVKLLFAKDKLKRIIILPW